MNILIVDDEKEIADLIEVYLNNENFNVLSKIENGKIKVNDPNSKKRSSMLWDYERLAPQIKNLWSFKV